MGQVRDGHALQPDFARAGQAGDEQTIRAEQGVTDAAHKNNVKIHGILEHPDMARVDLNGLAGPKVVHHGFAPKLDKGGAWAGEALHDKPIAAEQTGAELALEANRQIHTFSRAEEAMLVDHVGVTGGHIELALLRRRRLAQGRRRGNIRS